MAFRTDRDRRPAGDRDFRDPPRESANRRAAPAPNLNEFFIEGEGINREVLQIEICKYLGAEATCRPYNHNGCPGYKIKAMRPFTPQMLEDLRELSKTYESERMSSRRDPRSRPEGSPSQSTHVGDPNFGGAGTPYSESQTLQRRRDDPMYQHSPQYPQSELYSPNGSNGYGSTPGYGSSSASSYPSSESAYSSGTYGGSMISSSMSGQPNYATTGMPDPRYGTTNPSYTFGAPAENESYATYGQAYPTQPQYPPPPRTEMSGYYSSAADMRTVTAPVDPYTQDPYGPTYPRQTPVPGIGSQSVYPGSRPGPGPYDPNTYPTRPDQRNPYEQQPRRPHR